MKILRFLSALLLGLPSPAADRPNILWLSAEDINAHLGCYGDPHAITPNLDQLAKEGVRYTHAFTAAGVCAPCRSTIITGMYQTTIGTMHMRSSAVLPDSIKPFPVYLRKAGYYCTNNSKTDYQFRAPKNTWDESSGKAHWKNRKDKDAPFFAVFNFTGCHESGIASESKYQKVTSVLKPDQRQDPAQLTTLPPYYPDTPRVREDWKRNYELITALDHWVGKHLEALDEAGLDDNTIVIFWSDHGVGLPRAKRWLYDSGTRVPLIVRIPEKYRTEGQGQPGTTDDQLISSLDFGVTALNLAGLSPPAITQGRAFLGSNLTPERDYVYGARDRMDERYDIIRSVRDNRYRYLRNYEPLKPYYQYMNTPEKGATMKELRRVAATGEMPPAMKLFMADRKPVEKFYDLQKDPHEINNLAKDPAYQEELARFRKAHQQWSTETRDLGLIPEPEMVLREKKAGSRYDILAGNDDQTLPARLARMATLASERNSQNTDELLDGLKDKDAAVRYWAAIGLDTPLGTSEQKMMALLDRLKNDESELVRVAAAQGLLKIPQLYGKEALDQLTRSLESPAEWIRLHAAIVLDEADEKARPALPALQKALKNQPNKYIVRVANKAVNDLLGTSATVK